MAVSITMPAALEVRGLAKRFAAGAGGCAASALILRNVELTVRPGEAVAIVGGSGAGKSTLLLCLAGLLRPDHGVIRWFGDASRASAAQRVVYHITRTDLMRAGRFDEPNLHLVDAGRGIDSIHDLGEWVDGRRTAGDAVIVATRDADAANSVASRIVLLREGSLIATTLRARVAEALSS
jgi:ABC-type multidrug transport system ATPase subunit